MDYWRKSEDPFQSLRPAQSLVKPVQPSGRDPSRGATRFRSLVQPYMPLSSNYSAITRNFAIDYMEFRTMKRSLNITFARSAGAFDEFPADSERQRKRENLHRSVSNRVIYR